MLGVTTLSVIILSVIVLSIIVLSVIMLNVATPLSWYCFSFFCRENFEKWRWLSNFWYSTKNQDKFVILISAPIFWKKKYLGYFKKSSLLYKFGLILPRLGPVLWNLFWYKYLPGRNKLECLPLPVTSPLYSQTLRGMAGSQPLGLNPLRGSTIVSYSLAWKF